MASRMIFKQIFFAALVVDLIVFGIGAIVMIPQIRSGGLPWGTLALFVGTLVFAGGITWLVLRPLLREQALVETGEDAWGRLLSFWDTGTTINDNPLVGMQLEVHRKDGSFYQAKTTTVIPRLEIGGLREGAQVLLKVNRNNPQKVAFAAFHEGLDDTFSSQAGAAPPAVSETVKSRLEELDELRARGWIAEDLYQRRRAEILNLGVKSS